MIVLEADITSTPEFIIPTEELSSHEHFPFQPHSIYKEGLRYQQK